MTIGNELIELKSMQSYISHHLRFVFTKKNWYSICWTIEIRCEKGDFFSLFARARIRSFFLAYLFDWVGIVNDVRLWLFGVLMINDCKEFIFNRTVTIDLILYGRWREKKERGYLRWYKRVKEGERERPAGWKTLTSTRSLVTLDDQYTRSSRLNSSDLLGCVIGLFHLRN